MKDDDIDFSDIPLQDPADWKDAKWVRYTVVSVQGKPVKKPITMRLDNDVIEWFKKRTQKKGYRGYQTYINAVLRTYVAQQRSGPPETVGPKLRDRGR